MADQGGTAEYVLMQQIGIDAENIERRKRCVGFCADDLTRIAAIRDLVSRNREQYASTFFDFLGSLEEARSLFTNRALVDRARRLKSEHVAAMVRGDYGTSYVAQRIELGLIYGKVGLEPRAFLGAFHQMLEAIGSALIVRSGDDFRNFMALKKVAFFDIGIIVDVLVFERERIIRRQQEAIRELSTPVLQVRDRLLILPIIGVLDTHRARLLTDNLPQAIRARRARVVVVDVTGVAAVDSKVANHLLQAVTASRLMGATVIVTGLSSEVAQTLVTLGVDLAPLNTIGDLQGGIEEAERVLGYTMTVTPPPNGHGAGVHPQGLDAASA